MPWPLFLNSFAHPYFWIAYLALRISFLWHRPDAWPPWLSSQRLSLSLSLSLSISTTGSVPSLGLCLLSSWTACSLPSQPLHTHFISPYRCCVHTTAAVIFTSCLYIWLLHGATAAGPLSSSLHSLTLHVRSFTAEFHLPFSAAF